MNWFLFLLNFGVTIGFNRFNSKTMRQTGSSKKTTKIWCTNFSLPKKASQRPANMEWKKWLFFVSKVLEWNNVLAANMPIFTCFLENQAWHCDTIGSVSGNWRFEDVITVLVIRGLNRFLFEIQHLQTSDVHNLQLPIFFKAKCRARQQ